MIHHVALYKLQPDLAPQTLDEMIRRTRSLLLKIPEVLAVRAGKCIEPESEFPFFIALDFDSLAKQAMFRDDPIYLKFILEVIEPYTSDCMAFDYEMEPGKSVRYS